VPRHDAVILPTTVGYRDDLAGGHTCFAGGVPVNGWGDVMHSSLLGVNSAVLDRSRGDVRCPAGVGAAVGTSVPANMVVLGSPVRFLRRIDRQLQTETN
jgi:carbonic anhydrase/acetyltransferase-like protein (isoleucine patch superfamily)